MTHKKRRPFRLPRVPGQAIDLPDVSDKMKLMAYRGMQATEEKATKAAKSRGLKLARMRHKSRHKKRRGIMK